MQFRVEHEIPTAAERFWTLLHTPEFEAFMVPRLGLKDYRELERRQEGDLLVRRIEVVPDMKLPAAVAKVVRKQLGDREISYVEVQRKRLDGFELEWHSELPVLADRIKVGGRLWLEPIDEGRCRRVLEANVEVKVFGVGGMIERLIEQETRKTYGRFPEIVAAWDAQNS